MCWRDEVIVFAHALAGFHRQRPAIFGSLVAAANAAGPRDGLFSRLFAIPSSGSTGQMQPVMNVVWI